jgi:peptidoglycan/LPS O-acetylase OafA/YrhL
VLLTKAQVMIADDGFAQTLVLIRLDAFCAGMAASAITAKRPLDARGARVSALTGILMLAAVPWLFANQPGVVHYYDLAGFLRPFWMHFGICLVLCALTAARTAFVVLFDHPVVVWLGTISYSIYLWHLPVVELLSAKVLGTAARPPPRAATSCCWRPRSRSCCP